MAQNRCFSAQLGLRIESLYQYQMQMVERMKDDKETKTKLSLHSVTVDSNDTNILRFI